MLTVALLALLDLILLVLGISSLSDIPHKALKIVQELIWETEAFLVRQQSAACDAVPISCIACILFFSSFLRSM